MLSSRSCWSRRIQARAERSVVAIPLCRPARRATSCRWYRSASAAWAWWRWPDLRSGPAACAACAHCRSSPRAKSWSRVASPRPSSRRTSRVGCMVSGSTRWRHWWASWTHSCASTTSPALASCRFGTADRRPTSRSRQDSPSRPSWSTWRPSLPSVLVPMRRPASRPIRTWWCAWSGYAKRACCQPPTRCATVRAWCRSASCMTVRSIRPHADLVVVVPELTSLGEQASRFELLLGRAADLGVRLVAATTCPAEVAESPLVSQFTTRMVLRMQDEEASVALLGVADAAFLGGGGRLLLRLDGREPVELYGYQVPTEHLERLVRVMRSAYPAGSRPVTGTLAVQATTTHGATDADDV